MYEKILNILDNIRYWDSCPNDYKEIIDQFLAVDFSELEESNKKGWEVKSIAFAEWMAKEYWLNSSGKYMQGQTYKELFEVFKRESS